MARLNKQIDTFISVNQIKKPVILVVDMVNGFVKEGALADTAIMDIVTNQKRLMDVLLCKNVFICDSHPPKTREFDSYPPHCVIGTKEGDVIEELNPYIQEIVHKNSTNAFVSLEFQEFLKNIDFYRDIIIVGCCTDLCILQLGLCLQSWLNEHNMVEHRIIIPTDCVETYHIEDVHDAKTWNNMALENMKTNGITVVSSIVE